MFHWICPECGREIAPTMRECPVCDPVAATVENALAGEVEASARARKEAVAPVVSVTALAAETEPEPQPDQPILPVVAATNATVPVLSTPVRTAPNHIAPNHTAPNHTALNDIAP